MKGLTTFTTALVYHYTNAKVSSISFCTNLLRKSRGTSYAFVCAWQIILLYYWRGIPLEETHATIFLFTDNHSLKALGEI